MKDLTYLIIDRSGEHLVGEEWFSRGSWRNDGHPWVGDSGTNRARRALALWISGALGVSKTPTCMKTLTGWKKKKSFSARVSKKIRSLEAVHTITPLIQRLARDDSERSHDLEITHHSTFIAGFS